MDFLSLSCYKSYGDLYADYLEKHHVFVERLVMFDKPRRQFPSKLDVVFAEIVSLLKLLFCLGKLRRKKVFCTGSHFSILFLFRVFPFLQETSCLYIHNFYLHSLGNNVYVKRILSFLLGSNNVTIICQTPGEIDYYSALSSKVKLIFVPYCSDYFPSSPISQQKENYVFTGGYTNRDYALIKELANRYVEKQFVIVASDLNKDLSNMPENCVIYKNLSSVEFHKRMDAAQIVIIPLKEDVGSSGQMLCIAAMRHKKPIVYANVSSINYYFTLDFGFPYSIGDVDSLDTAFNECLKSMGSDDIGKLAYERSLDFTLEKCFEQFNEILKIEL